MKTNTENCWVFLTILLLAALLRLAWVALSDGNVVLSRWGKQNSDAIEYHGLAKNILAGEGYCWKGKPTSYRPPLYPAFIAGIYFLAKGVNLLAIRFVQAAIGVLTVLLIFFITRLLFRKRRAEIIAGFLASIYILHIYWTSELYTETLFMLLIASSVFSLLKFAQKEKGIWLLAGGAVLGLAALCRSTALIFAAFAILWLLIYFRKNWGGFLRRIFTFLCPLILVILPWTVRNYQVHHAFVLISTNGGRTFSAGVAQDYLSTLGLKGLIPKTRLHSGTEAERDKCYYGIALRAVRKNKRTYAELIWRKFLHFWSPFVRSQRPLFVILGAVFYLPILILGTLGIIFSSMKRDASGKMVILILFLFLSFSLLHAIYIPNIRFRLPVVDPYLMAFTGYLIAKMIKGRR